MLTIQSIMLLLLGFLVAALLVMLVAPAYRRRVQRLTVDGLRRTMPLTEEEIRADKDRLRAEHAIRVRELEESLDRARLSAARQRIEINRREALASELSRTVERLQFDIEENVNARRVLEQTVTETVPKIERRLADARRDLDLRDKEVAALTTEGARAVRALDEAMQINAQLRSDLERMRTSLATRGARNRDGLADPTFDREVALVSELEANRARVQELTSLADRLQRQLSGRAGGEPAAERKAEMSDSSLAGAGGPAETDIEQLRQSLAEAQIALQSARSIAADGEAGRSRTESELSATRDQLADQKVEIERLRAAVAAFEKGGEGDERGLSVRDSKIAMRAKISSLESQVHGQEELVRRLRSDLAAANERLALQAAHFREELRRLGGAGAGPAAARPAVLSQRPRRSLADRIGEVKPELAPQLQAVQAQRPPKSPSAAPANGNGAAGAGGGGAAPAGSHEGAAEPLPQVERAPPASTSTDPDETAAPAAADAAEARAEPGKKRIRLLERIAAISKG